MKKQIRHYLISGRVQGVGYRAFVKRTAERLGLCGWVRNLADGRVEALIAASENQFRQLEAELKQGPSHALVEQLRGRIVDDSFVWENFSIASTGDKEWSSKG